MNIKRLKNDLELDEGIVYKIYLDHLGYKTFGVGHLVQPTDPEYLLSVGEQVSKERVDECFDKDVNTCIDECKALYDDFDELPTEAQLIIANMMFNLGRTNLSKFKGMKRGVDSRNWALAANEMVDSLWYRQVTNRAERLVKRMKNVSNT